MTPLLEAGRLWGVQKPVWGLRATEDLLAPGVPGCPFSIQGQAAPEARALLIAAQVQESELGEMPCSVQIGYGRGAWSCPP